MPGFVLDKTLKNFSLGQAISFAELYQRLFNFSSDKDFYLFMSFPLPGLISFCSLIIRRRILPAAGAFLLGS